MPRFTKKQYNQQVAVVMTIYIAIMLLVWPRAHRVANIPLRAVFALAAAAPVVVMIWLMAKLVMHSDELNQRVHLMALSAATGTVAALSLVGGFLCAAGVLILGGDILIWVFPALCLAYSAAHALFARRYGGVGCG